MRDIAREAETATQDHLLAEQDVVALEFATEGTNVYAFNLVWVPGFVFVGGDIGEITFCHYSAFSTLRSAMSWLSGRSDDYQLSKTNIAEVLDRDKTIQHIKGLMAEADDYDLSDGDIATLLELCEQIRGDDLHDAEIRRLIYDSGQFDDWYGSDRYPEHAHFQLACIRNAATRYLAENEEPTHD